MSGALPVATGTDAAGPSAARHSASGRIVALDGLRGVAILLVMLHHFLLVQPNQLWEQWLVSTIHFGWAGVDLFFVLSGFLITGILLDARQSPRYFRSFYARRVLRIFPLYYALLFFSLVLLPLVPHPKIDVVAGTGGHDIAYWAFLSNWSIALDNAFHNRILAPTWSLAIEEQFYLVWPLVVLAIGGKRLLWVCPLLAVSSLVLRLVLLHGADAGYTTVYVLTPCRFDGLALGAWVAAFARHGKVGNGQLSTRGLSRVTWIGVACLAAGYLGEMITLWTSEGRAYSRSEFALGPGFTLLAIGFACLVMQLASATPPSWAGFLSHPVLCSFGKYSYAIYLTHMPLRAGLRDLVLGPASPGTSPMVTFADISDSPWPGQLCFFLLATSLSWGVGWASWRVLERHFVRLKLFFPY